MVKSKKPKVVAEENSEQPTETEASQFEMPIATETATPYMQTNEDIMAQQTVKIADLIRLLNDAPKRPQFIRMEDCVSFADSYDKWNAKVRLFWSKQ
jgi:hypothetical protein